MYLGIFASAFIWIVLRRKISVAFPIWIPVGREFYWWFLAPCCIAIRKTLLEGSTQPTIHITYTSKIPHYLKYLRRYSKHQKYLTNLSNCSKKRDALAERPPRVCVAASLLYKRMMNNIGYDKRDWKIL